MPEVTARNHIPGYSSGTGPAFYVSISRRFHVKDCLQPHLCPRIFVSSARPPSRRKTPSELNPCGCGALSQKMSYGTQLAAAPVSGAGRGNLLQIFNSQVV